MNLKVAFLGNINNNHFSMVRFLRNLSVDAHLLLYDTEGDHFMPYADAFDLSYRQYTRQLSWGTPATFLRTTPEQIRKDLEPYQVLVGCGLAPAYCARACRKLDVFAPVGGDIWDYTFYRLASPHLLVTVWFSTFFQRKGIPLSRVFHMTRTNPLYEKQFEKYRGNAERWLEGLPIVHSPTYAPEVVGQMKDRTHWGHEFQALRDRNELMVFYHGRHAWGAPSDPSNKGVDKLLRGWAMFRSRCPGIRAALVTLEYGADIRRSVELVRELGIENSVHWFPKMFRKDVMVGLNLADIACGEFCHSWVASGVLYEALVLGKPILSWRNDPLYQADYPNLYPILNARDPEDIARCLEDFHHEPEKFRAMGKSGRVWYDAEVVKKALDKYVALIRRRADEIG